MYKTAILITIIIVGAFGVDFQLWTANNRFYIVSGPDGAVHEFDRKTGNSWYIKGARTILQENHSPISR